MTSLQGRKNQKIKEERNMKRRILYSLGTLVVGALTIAAVANGPYYALPAWAQKLVCATTSNCPRFIVLADWNSEAVLDRETGLVWDRSPVPQGFSWSSAVSTCVARKTGNRFGWRLPTVNELASLFDPSATNVPFLPSGHPFNGLPTGSTSFWTVTPGTDTEFQAHRNVGYTLSIGGPSFSVSHVSADTFALGVWCVRGGLFPGPQ
jgi:hypothetical protein